MADENLYTTQTPDSLDNAEDTYTMGTEVVFARDGVIKGIRWRSATNAIGTSPNARVYSSVGVQLATKAAGVLTSGNTWNTITFDTPLAVTAGTYYIVAFGPINRYSALSGMHASADVVNGNVTAPQNGVGGHSNGRFVANAATTFPTSSGGAGYFVDVVYEVTGTTQNGAGDLTIADAIVGAGLVERNQSGDRSVSAAITGAATVVHNATGDLTIAIGTLNTGALNSDASPPRLDNSAGWYQLLDIWKEAKQIVMDDATMAPVACPNDGEPLLTGPNGELFCRYDGWTPQ